MTLIFDVIIVGNYSIDFIFSGMDEFPQLGKDIISKAFFVSPGEAYISAVCMHRLGIKVGWAADFGNDEYSQLALKRAREEGLDESLFILHDWPYRRISVSASYPQDRGFLTYYDPDPQIPAAIPALAKSQAKFVFIPGLYTGTFMDTGIKLMRLKKMKLIMDGNSSVGDILGKDTESKAIRKSIKSVDIFLPNAQEARRLTGETNINLAAEKLGKISPFVVIKDGAGGSMAIINHTITHVPGIPILPIDTTGAGDNFNAGFLRAYLDGKSIESCLRWGNITGGLSTTELGGTSRRITVEIVNEAFRNYYPAT